MLNRRPVLAAALMLLPVSSAMACNTPTDLCINEVQTYGTGSPTARRATQYIELRGPAGATIAAGHYLVAVDGDRNQNPGTIDVVLSLEGKTLGANGYLVLLAQGNSYVSQPGATVLSSNASGFSGIAGWSGNAGAVAFERPSTSFFLVTAASAPLPGTDIDTIGSNDGVPDGSGYGAWTILDSVAIADNANDKTYAALNFRPSAGSVGSTVILAGRTWYAGRFGDSFGSAANAWVASSVLGGANPNYLLAAAAVTPIGVAGKPLNHIGASNTWANAAPVNALPASASTLEDAGVVLALGVADSDAAGSNLTVSVSVDVGALTLANTAGIVVDSGSNGSAAMVFSGALPALGAALNGLQFSPPANFNGTATLSITTNDNGNTGTDGAKSDSDTLTIAVTAVNDVPSFAVGTNQTVASDAGAQIVNGFATALSAGPADESAQGLDFIVGNDANGLFLVQPAIAANGTLTYTPNPSLTGIATVSVRIHDDGGTANGGVDTSALQTFTITVDPPLQAATLASIDDDDGDDLLAAAQVVNFTLNFSRAIDFASVSASDFSFTGTGTATVDAVSQIDADSVAVQATATGSGTIVLTLSGEVLDTFAIAVSAPSADDTTLTIDAVAPTLTSITRVSASPSNAATVDFDVTFSESLSTVGANDFTTAADGTLAGFGIAAVSGSGSHYTVTVNAGSGDGHLALGLAAAPVATDVAGNTLATSLLSASYVMDRTAPLAVVMNKLDADLPTMPFVRFAVEFDESVTGLDPSDFNVVAGGGVTEAMVVDVTGSGTSWTVLVYTGLASGTLGLDLLDDDSIVDAATNPLAGGLVGTQFYLIDASVLIPLFKDGFEN